MDSHLYYFVHILLVDHHDDPHQCSYVQKVVTDIEADSAFVNLHRPFIEHFRCL